MAKNSKSIEEQVEDWCKQQFKGQKYYTKTEAVNAEIASALEKAPSKQGGTGKNFPDLKCLLTADDGKRIPVMIEVKGRKGDLIKASESGEVDNFNKKGEPNYQNIAKYAVNGAVHYANALLHYTDYEDIISIGVTGYKNESGKLQHEIGVYYVSGKNYGYGQEVAKYTDLSFLKNELSDAYCSHPITPKISINPNKKEITFLFIKNSFLAF